MFPSLHLYDGVRRCWLNGLRVTNAHAAKGLTRGERYDSHENFGANIDAIFLRFLFSSQSFGLHVNKHQKVFAHMLVQKFNWAFVTLTGGAKHCI